MTDPTRPASSPGDDRSLPPELRLLRWNDPAVLAVAVVALASGFGQFGAVAALGDVAKGFGQVNHGATIADQAGLSGTALGIGLAIIRLASLAALPIAGLADRLGRRALLLGSAAVGLALTATASLSPTYWWFIVIFACGRPMLIRPGDLRETCAECRHIRNACSCTPLAESADPENGQPASLLSRILPGGCILDVPAVGIEPGHR